MLCERYRAISTTQHLPPCTCGKHRIEHPPKNHSVRSDLRIAARYLNGQLSWVSAQNPTPCPFGALTCPHHPAQPLLQSIPPLIRAYHASHCAGQAV